MSDDNTEKSPEDTPEKAEVHDVFAESEISDTELFAGDLSKVQVFKRVNKLKRKVGGSSDPGAKGTFDPKLLHEAHKAVRSRSKEFYEQTTSDIERLRENMTMARQDPANSMFHLNKLHDVADKIMSTSGMYGYHLLIRFGKSLCRYLGEIEQPEEQHMMVIQYHVDAMYVVLRDKLRGHGDETGKNLALSLEIAIKKFGPKSHTGQKIKKAKKADAPKVIDKT